MFNFNQVKIANIVVHKIGNKGKDEGTKIANSVMPLPDENVQELLLKYFLSPFKEEAFYHFHHPNDVNQNELFDAASKIFAESWDFYPQSINIARLLYDCSTHPRIKSGEFYMVSIKDCVVESELVDAIGIFKSENKETYLKVYPKGENFEISPEEGINLNRLDKGCLIFNTEKNRGYKVCMVDNLNKGADASSYWKDDFLQIKQRDDSFSRAKNFIGFCKEFIEEELVEDNGFVKQEQMQLRTRSMDYFTQKDKFNEKEFEEQVIHEPMVIESFRKFKEDYSSRHEVDIPVTFDLPTSAVKDAKKAFKSVLKLDKNFHVYIHGRHDYVEKGFDSDRQLSYYKFYYLEEL